MCSTCNHGGCHGSGRSRPSVGWLSALALAIAAVHAFAPAASAGPQGDECTDCIPIIEGVHAGSTFDNTGTVDDTSCSTNDTVDEWWCYTASCSGLATITTCDAALFDTSLGIFSDCNGTQIACNDDDPACAFDTSTVTWPVTEGVTYYVRVAGFFFQQGDYVMTVTCNGCPGSGDCFAANGTPGCDDFDCCEEVCLITPACCNVVWDSACALTATDECLNANCGTGANCFLPGGAPGCDDVTCCNTVCDLDAFCCDVVWDASCAGTALVQCADEACPGAGTCFDPNGSPACDDNLCCNVICIQDPFCCDTEWDASCSDAADLQCEQPPACGVPGTGDCFAANGTPYCESEECCDLVCTAFIQCCIIEWDAACAAMAEAECRPPNDDCADLIDVVDGSIAFSTVDGTTDGLSLDDNCDPGPSGDDQIHNDIWFRYVAPCSGELTVSTCGTADYDTRLAVYTGDTCPEDPAAVVGCNDDDPSCAGFTSLLTVPIDKDAVYTIRVGGFSAADSGTGTLTVSHVPAAPPTLTLRSIVPPGGLEAGENFDVWIEMASICPEEAIGFAGFLQFDTALMSYVSGDYTAEPFGLPGITPITATAGGEIDVAAAIDGPGGQTATSDDAVLAILTFQILESSCEPIISFRDPDPGTRVDRLGGGEIGPLALDSFPPDRIPGDVNFDGEVDVVDLIDMIKGWGVCPPPPDFCAADIDCSGEVDILDLIEVLINWTDF